MNLDWQYSTVHNCACKVVEEQTLWGRDGVPCLVAEPGRGGARPAPPCGR
jgi:hypothetical protein